MVLSLAARLAAGSSGSSEPNAADWALLAAICALATVTFLYADARTTWQHSFNFLDAVFSGRLLDFYQIAIENAGFGHPAVYDVPIYAVFACGISRPIFSTASTTSTT